MSEWHGIFETIRTDRYAGVCFAVQYIEKKIDALTLELNLDESMLSDHILGGRLDIGSIHSYMEELFLGITSSVSRKKHAQSEVLANRVDEYMRKHYAEETLSTQQIADHFEINQVYLSRQFRKLMGMSVSDAIHKVRIEKAQQMLRGTNKSVESVASSSGYPNSKYFFVIFKKLTGVTPSQFRKSSVRPQ